MTAGGLALVGFVATSPYVVLHLGEAAGDAWRVQQDARAGWLGFEQDGAAPIGFATRLWEGFGPVLVIAAVGLVLALVQRRRADLVLAVFVLVYFASLLTIDAHFDRYVLPLVPALGALAGRFRALAPRDDTDARRSPTWAVRDARDLTRTDAALRAHGWVEQNLRSRSDARGRPSTPDFAGFRVLRLALPRPGGSLPTRTATWSGCASAASGTSSLPARSRIACWPQPPTIRARRAFSTTCGRRRGVYAVQPGGELTGPWIEIYRL